MSHYFINLPNDPEWDHLQAVSEARLLLEADEPAVRLALWRAAAVWRTGHPLDPLDLDQLCDGLTVLLAARRKVMREQKRKRKAALSKAARNAVQCKTLCQRDMFTPERRGRR
jgi:hypothetical protein